ncbi:MAG TPA: NAD(P)/FAD-dependent oxidoreductase [Methylomirabilota bacterium]|nr:NAD(P)/FAD-dependent oxidoreductase [Methylomirabilota bacterium]
MEKFDTDVFVAGGGPAGLSVAIAARLAGLDVWIADRARPPIDKACGEGILPQGMAALKQLGVRLPPERVRPFRGIRFVDASGQAEARFSENEFGMGVRRTVLHEALARRAEEVGVRMQWGARVEKLNEDCVTVEGESIRARWRVCADGRNSRLRAHAGLEPSPKPALRKGQTRHYLLAPWTDLVEVYWNASGQLYVTPISGTEICVAHITRNLSTRFDDALRDFPAVAQKLAGAKISSPLFGAVTLSRRLRKVAGQNVALLGEAAGSVDAVTGAGLTIAFQEALALADAMRAGNLSAYQAAHAKISRLPHLMSRMLLCMDRIPAVRRRVLRAFAAEPRLFSALLAMHADPAPRVTRSARKIFSLGWHVLTA